MYIKKSSGEKSSLSQIMRETGANLSRNPSDETLAALGYARIQPTPRPTGDVVTQGQPEQDSEGVWRQTWEVRDFTQEELEHQRQSAVPQSITPRQARLALLQAGLLAQVETAVDALESPAKDQVKIEWEYATTVERDSEWVDQLGSALGLDAAGIDDLFIAASAI